MGVGDRGQHVVEAITDSFEGQESYGQIQSVSDTVISLAFPSFIAMQTEITFVPSLVVMRRVARRDWVQNYLVGYLWFLAIPLLTLVMCLGSGEMSFSKPGGWLLGMLLGIVMTFVFLLVYSYSKTQQVLAKAARKWKAMEVKYTFDNEGLLAQSELSSSRRSWQMVQKAQMTPEALLLFFGEQSYVALPSEQITEDLRKFIFGKVAETGGKVGR